MKVIRLTDDRYIIDAGPDGNRDFIEHLGRAWDNWWATHPDPPSALVLSGRTFELVYEDRRDPGAIQMARIEEKLDRILEKLS